VVKKKVKRIKIDLDKCNGCRLCEVACSAFHSRPKYSAVNPARSRIRIVKRELDNFFIPVIASAYTKAECPGRNLYVQSGTEYGECAFCGASCPSRDEFKEPDSGLPLKCDMCEGQEEPWCTKMCLVDALTCEEREEEVEEESREEMEIGLEALADRYGLDKIIGAVARMSMSKESQNIKAKEENQ
jgi:benzoyl-CoA reductase subunit BamC